MLAFIFATNLYFILEGTGGAVPVAGYFQAIIFAVVVMVALVGLCSIPVLIVCYLIKVIPDIDYSINVAFAVTIIGIISEYIF